MRKGNIVVYATFDYEGLPDFYRGHGHCFVDPTLIACLRFGVYVNYSESIQEIIDMIVEDLQGTEYEIINKDLFKKYEHILYSITDEDLAKCLLEQIPNEYKPTDSFWKEGVEVLNENTLEYPMLIGYIHFFVCEE